MIPHVLHGPAQDGPDQLRDLGAKRLWKQGGVGVSEGAGGRTQGEGQGAHLQHQLAGEVEEGNNTAPVEGAVGKHLCSHAEEELLGGMAPHLFNHPGGVGGY